MSSVCLKLMVVLCVATCTTALFCKLEEASDEKLNVSTDHIVWYEQYRYRYPLSAMELFGCLTMDVSPGAGPGDIVLAGNFSRSTHLKMNGKAHLTGNRMVATYDGIFGGLLGGPRNVIATDNEKYFIDHFCLLGTEISTIFTNVRNPSQETMDLVWKVVEEHPIVKRARYNAIKC